MRKNQLMILSLLTSLAPYGESVSRASSIEETPICSETPPSGQIIFGDQFQQGWAGYTWSVPSSGIDGNLKCRGSSSFLIKGPMPQYSGMVIQSSAQPGIAKLIKVKVYVDKPATFTLGIGGYPGENPSTRTFLQNSQGEVYRVFQPGWQKVEGIVPAEFGGVRIESFSRVMFEIHDQSNPSIFAIDDLTFE